MPNIFVNTQHCWELYISLANFSIFIAMQNGDICCTLILVNFI